MKKILALVLSLILIFNSISFSYASMIEGLKDVSPSDSLGSGLSVTNDYTNLEDRASGDSPETNGILQTVVGLLTDLLNIITKPIYRLILDSPTIEGSIWAKQDYFQLTFFHDAAEGFGGSIQQVIGNIYNALRYLVAAIYVVILVYLGIRMMLSSIGREKARYKVFLQYWFMGLLLLFAFHWIMAFIIWMAEVITQMMANVGMDIVTSADLVAKFPLDASLIHGRARGFSSLLIGIFSQPVDNLFVILQYFINFVLAFALLVFQFIIAFTYLKRLFTISLLIVLFPLVVLSYVFDKIGDRKAQVFGTWIKEFVVNVFIQPIHAFLLMLIAYLLQAGSKDGGLFTIPLLGGILAVILLVLIPIGEKQIKSLFQISSSMGPGASGIAGSAASALMAGGKLKDFSNSAKNKLSTTADKLGSHANKLIRGAQADRNLTKDARAHYNDNKKNMSADEKKSLKKEFKKSIKEIRSSEAYKKAGGLLAPPGKGAVKRAVKAAGTGLLNGVGTVVAKASVQSASVGVALGSALAKSNDPDKLPVDLLSSVGKGLFAGHLINSVGGEVVGSFVSAMQGVADNNNQSPEVDAALNSLRNSTNLNKLDDKIKQAIANASGLGEKSLITESNRASIEDRLNVRQQAAKFGLSFNDPLVSSLDSDAQAIRNIKSGKNAAGTGSLNLNDYDIALGSEAGFLKDKKSGHLYKIDGFSDSNAKGDLVWQDGATSSEQFKDKLKSNALDLAKAMATGEGRAFDKDDANYDKYLNRLNQDATRHGDAQAAFTNFLQDSNHTTLVATNTPSYQTEFGAAYSNFSDVRNSLSTPQLQHIIDNAGSFGTLQTGTPEQIGSALNKMSVLYNAGGPIGFSGQIDAICEQNNCSFSELSQMASDPQNADRFATICQSVQSQYKNCGSDTQRTIYANAQNMQEQLTANLSSALDSLSSLVTNSTLNQAVSSVLPGQNADSIRANLSSLSYSEQQSVLSSINLYKNAENTLAPFNSTVIQAYKTKSISTPLEIPIDVAGQTQSAVNQELLNVFSPSSTQPRLTTITRSAQDTNGMFTYTVSAIDNPSDFVTFTSPNGGNGASDLEISYAGSVNSTSDGSVELLSSEAELTYNFNSTSTSRTASLDSFADLSFAEMSAYAGKNSGSNEFTVIKNADIVAILDSQNNIIDILDGKSVVDAPTQFRVKLDPGTQDIKIVSDSIFGGVERGTGIRLKVQGMTEKDETKKGLISAILAKK